MKLEKIIYWIATGLIFLFEGVMPALTWNSAEAKAGISHLGYPVYFSGLLAIFKVLGVLAIVLPQVPNRVKEWAYAGFGFDFLFASLSYYLVDGICFFAFMPYVFLAVLAVSYIYKDKIKP